MKVTSILKKEKKSIFKMLLVSPCVDFLFCFKNKYFHNQNNLLTLTETGRLILIN